MLHEGAQMVVSEYAGVLPQTVTELKRIPGIGPYTGSLCYYYVLIVILNNAYDCANNQQHSTAAAV
jgi:endonuclease III